MGVHSIEALLVKLHGFGLNDKFATPEVIDELIRVKVNEFTAILPSTVARMYLCGEDLMYSYSELMAHVEENQAKITDLPYEIKNELNLYSYPDERSHISIALSQIAAVAKEIDLLEKYLEKQGLELILKRTQEVFIQNCILTLTTILQSFSMNSQSVYKIYLLYW